MEKYSNRITRLFQIRYPVIQAGMVWASGWKLASAVSQAGGLGLIGSGSMHPDLLRDHIRKCRQATDSPFGVNIPLMYREAEAHMKTVVAENVKIVFTSAGNPALWTDFLQSHGIRVVHVAGSSKFARKAEDCGADAVVAEGFEAGGHNGRDETTTLVLVPAVCDAVKIPVIAAGGIWSGKSMLAAMVLGAEGVQVGSRFAASEESSAHAHFKQAIIDAAEGDTMLVLKKLMPVRMLKNDFYNQVRQAEDRGASEEELQTLLGRTRSKKGMFEGDLENGELEIGQVSALIHEILPAATILSRIWQQYMEARNQLCFQDPAL